MKVAVPWLQHSQRFGHCALSQTVCNRKSEISALVEKKTGFDGNRTLIQGGFCAWCRAGSILAQDISNESYNVKNVTKVKSLRIALTDPYAASLDAVLSEAFHNHDVNKLKSLFADDLEFYQDNEGLVRYEQTVRDFESMLHRGAT